MRFHRPAELKLERWQQMSRYVKHASTVRGTRAFRLSEKPKDLRDGKEDSYERNPGRVSFVFNHKFSELKKFRKLAPACRKGFFGKLEHASTVRGTRAFCG